MPRYPTPSDYQEAVQFPETAFFDADLQEAEPDTNALGLPQPITGNFAAVFPMTDAVGRRWAVKCFLTRVEDQQSRYHAIDRHLDAHDLSQMVAFDYQEHGIRVDGSAYPILKMEWVDGIPLNRYVATHLDAPDVLRALAEAWRTLLADLEAARIAHGDLQHGNVLVADTGAGPTLRLVDYDTMYVPALRGHSSAEVGHRNYQHPDRTEADFGPHLDRFAGLVIYTALQACIADPALWERYDTGENLLLRADDFYDPAASPVVQNLSNIEAIQSLVDATRTACLVGLEAIPTLEDVRDGNVSVDRAKKRSASRSPARRDSPWRRRFLPLVGGVCVAAAGVSLAWSVGGGLIFLAVGAAVLVGLSGIRYRRLPLVRRRRRLEQERAYVTSRIERLERQVDALQAKKKAVQRSVQARREERLRELQEEALYDRLKYHFVGEARGVEGITHKHVVRLKAAGLRTAYAVTEEALKGVREIGERTTVRLVQWRAALVEQYRDDIPTTLSPAEERRISRYVEHRVEDLDREIARTREKVRVQEAAREQVRKRMDALPAVSFVEYLQYLLRLSSRSPEVSDRVPRDGNSPSREPASLPDPLPENRPWWTQAGG